MATVEECRAALVGFSARLAENADEVRAKVNLDRRLVCRITDLDVAFRARLVGGELRDLTEGDDPAAEITLTTTSDDLIALTDGRLDLVRAVASGRVTISANPFDLLKLRKLR